jgi:hypothetical protein
VRGSQAKKKIGRRGAGRAREGGGAGSWHRRGEAVGASEGASVAGEDRGGAAHGGRARRRQEGRGRVRRRGRGGDDAAARGGGAAQHALVVGGGGRWADAQGPGKTMAAQRTEFTSLNFLVVEIPVNKFYFIAYISLQEDTYSFIHQLYGVLHEILFHLQLKNVCPDFLKSQ